MCKCHIILFMWFCGSALGFNLEYRIPVIKYGEKGSYFGYSVAEHMISGRKSENLLLVGAPLGQNLQPETNRSGCLMKCKISTNPYDCEQVITDGRRRSGGKFISSDETTTILTPPDTGEMKNGQWMGSVVRSKGKRVLVCAHRFMRNYWGPGLCYMLNNDLTLSEYLEPCAGQSTNRAHEEFGYCQVGTSGELLEDGTVIMGSPGPYTWRGTIYVTDMNTEFFARDHRMYRGPLTQTESKNPIAKYSYLGMSVAAGNFLDANTSYAAGGPRSNNTGQVMIFSKDEKRSEIMMIELTLSGEQFASSYGYEILGADVNSDGLQDLLVSAPFYFTKYEGGAVYVYINTNQSCKLSCSPPMKLTGKLESRFGYSLTNLGDLNKDGYDDIAIGAPYEGNGVVYIYLGSKNGLMREPSQRIPSESLPGKPIQSFGYSLNGGKDLDGNGYPDLLVGAYESDAVVLLRARPIIDIKSEIRSMENLRNIDFSIKDCRDKDNATTTCFSFMTCCKIMSLAESTQSQNLLINYNIEAETFPGNNRKFSRVWFGSNSNNNHIVRRTIHINKINDENCETHIVHIKNNTKDILSPIKFRLNYTLEQATPRYKINTRLPNIDNYPILNQQEAEKIFNATFQKDCGSNDICESDIIVQTKILLKERKNRYILTLGLEEEVILDINVENFGEPAYEAQIYIAHPAGLNYIGIKTPGVLCNTQNQSQVVCSLGNPFKKNNKVHIQLRFDPRTLDDNVRSFKFIVHANSTSTEISKKYPQEVKVVIIKTAEVSMKGSTLRTTVIYGGDVKGESVMKYGDDIGSNVTHVYQIVNNGPWKVPRLTVIVSWPFQTANNREQGKWLLYLEKPPIIDAPNGGQCSLSYGQVNPLNLTARPEVSELSAENLQLPKRFPDKMYETRGPNRVRRNVEARVPSRIITDRDGFKKEVVTMDCETKTAKCIQFECTIYNLPRYEAATLRIRARLWNSTLVEDYPKVDYVEIVSRAKIEIPAEYSIQQDTTDDSAYVETIAYPDIQQSIQPIPWWIIIVSIVVGLLLFIILVVILWKCGFFKRKRPHPTKVKLSEEKPMLDST